ncbi:DUF2511 domain-containing protein [Tellurirhabdus rosea]|uniref:DUF2511 domain-containing protein n=1 Tax=Tellurirhabdus rosea TaxID=2674997 RepID=UPI00224F97F3|nr:DUF2511 domain-containing protein [Tellurirhabdus rosea]
MLILSKSLKRVTGFNGSFFSLALSAIAITIASCATEGSKEQVKEVQELADVNPYLMTKKDLGAEWPLNGVDQGVVKCLDGRVVLETDQATYALNGTAQSVAEDEGWIKVDEIQITGKDISPMIKKGLEQCE